MRTGATPKWLYILALVVVLGQLGALITLVARWLHGPDRNVVFQVLIGGVGVLFILVVYLFRFYPDRVRFGPGRLGIVLLVLLGLGFTALYVYSVHPLLVLPYDLASWSEPMFMVDIIKWHIGARMYLPPGDSNSNHYTFAASAVTYFLAWLLGDPTSIPLYRLVLQGYLVLAAVFAAMASWQLLRLASPEGQPTHSRLWLLFFVLISFLLAVNPHTGAFNVFLHNEQMAFLFSMVSFWLLSRLATPGHHRWFWAMALMPTLGFLLKQYLLVWGIVFVVYLWLDGRYTLRRVLLFGGLCFGLWGATVGVCLAAWGSPFFYWVFQVMGGHEISVTKMADRFVDAAPYLLPGFFGGIVLLRGSQRKALLPLWAGWIILTLAGIYTSGVAFSPTHLGPATLVGSCFALAAVAMLLSREGSSGGDYVHQWLHLSIGVIVVATYLVGIGYLRPTSYRVSPDLSRYVRNIEREFEDLPVERVLLDSGEWIYLRHNLLMKDRIPILLTHRRRSADLLERVRAQAYDRMLIRQMPNGNYVLDMDVHKGTMEIVKKYYGEVRRIPGVRGMETWRYYFLTLSDISVFEPIPQPEETTQSHGSARSAESPNALEGSTRKSLPSRAFPL